MDIKPKAKDMIKEILTNSYKEAFEAKDKGIPVGWASSVVVQELAETFGLPLLYPENHAAAVAAKGEGQTICEHAEKNGYSNDLCSYARINLAYADLKSIESINMPLPDFVIVTNNICNTLVKWYENLAKTLNIPYILIDTPFNNEYEPTQEIIDYIKAQIQEAIGQFEVISGKQFDEERFKEVMKISSEAGRLWNESMSLAQAKPSPMNGFELFNYMGVIVCARGKQKTVEAFKLLKEELEEKIANGVSSYKGEEKFRIMFDGIPCWPYLGHNVKTLNAHGINSTGSVYVNAWAIEYDVNDLDGLARGYSIICNNINLDRQVDIRAEIIEKYKCDGATFHNNRSCKVMDHMQYELQRRIEAKTGIPTIMFDGDQADPRNFAKAQFELRIQALKEVMEERKKGR